VLSHCIATAPLHKIAGQVYRAEGKLPKELLNGPELLPGNWLFLQSCFNLHYERPSGEVLMPIPWSAIQKYAEFLGLDGEQLYRFHTVIRGVDESYLETTNKAIKREMRRRSKHPQK
jgi:hypothetical protein